jgi:hypothetical protein
MATATKQKVGKKTYVDKDVQSLMELQEKLSVHAGLCQMVRQLCRLWICPGVTAVHPCSIRMPRLPVLQMQRQLQASKLQQRRTELALSQLTELPLEVPVYKQVGKA